MIARIRRRTAGAAFTTSVDGGNGLQMRHRGLRYMPALDGLRAVAVIAVLLYHGDVTWLRGGYFGVDAFFVLSGFLITSLLLNEHRETGHIDLKAFWARRARRLLPALALVLAGVALYAARSATPLEWHQLRQDGLSTVAYIANWNQIFSHQSYFQQFAAPSALRHTWSLAIEEQFYLVWPLAVFAALQWRRVSRRAMFLGCGVAAAASAVLMGVLYRSGHDPSRVYYGTDTRAQSLLIGAMLAMLLAGRERELLTPRRRTALHGGAIAAAAGLGFIWATTTDGAAWQYRGGFALAAVLVCVVIASVTQPDNRGPLGAVFSFAPLRAIGMISYGLYLWHWPVFVYLDADRTGLDPSRLLLVRLIATFGIATTSYFLVERPVRHGFLRGWRVRVVTPAVASMIAVALITSTAGAVPPEFHSISAAELAPPPPPPPAISAVVTPRPLRVMLVGDSVAASMAPGVAKMAAVRGYVFWSAAVPGCGIASDVGERWFAEWRGVDPKCLPGWRARFPGQVARFHPDIVLALFGGQDAFDRRINGHITRFDTPDGAALRAVDLEDVTAVLSATGARVLLLTTPYYKIGWPQKVQIERSPLYEPWINRYNDVQRSVMQQSGGRVSVLDLNRYLDPNGVWTDTVNGIKVRTFDRCHLSAAGADFVAKWLVPQLARYKRPVLGPHTETLNASVPVARTISIQQTRLRH